MSLESFLFIRFIPFQIQSIARSKAVKPNVVQTPSVAEAKKRDSNKQQQSQQNASNNGVNDLQQQQNAKVALANNSTNTIAENGFAATAANSDKTKQSELLKVMEMPTPAMPMQAPPSAAVATTGAAVVATPVAPPPKSAPKPSPITSNSRRRKSISTLVANHSPAKAMMISNRRDTMIETYPKIREHQPVEPLHRIAEPLLAFQHKKSTATTNNARSIISQKLDPPPANSATVFASKPSLHPTQSQPTPAPPPPTPQSTTSQKKTHMQNNDDVQIIEAFLPHNVSTIKGTRNVMNAISQGAQLVKVIDSKIIKHPVTMSNMYVTAPAKSTPSPMQVQQPQQQQLLKTISDSAGRLTKVNNMGNKAAKVEIIALPPPSARNPNIVKTSDKIVHVAPHQMPAHQKSNQTIRTAVGSVSVIGSGGTHHIPATVNIQNRQSTTTAAANAVSVPKYQQKNHIVQVVQSQPRMVTIHPSSAILNGKQFVIFCNFGM